MSREWKPGDVALIRTGLGFDAIGLRSGVPSNMGWAYTSDVTRGGPKHYGNCWTSDRDGDDVIRPLVVIDPEDREQVERLIECWADVTGAGVNRMQDALREFANPTPPKPEEPTGLGAVVEDAEGGRWVRTYGKASTADYECWRREHHTTRHRWSEVAAVGVLSEGVQP